ncbi:MAG: hypothetical protein M1837_003256 [Sclerophora amabilis]|nr:MAG: hypothetical protein M1837_003256 [Sclerophora amabilis]
MDPQYPPGFTPVRRREDVAYAKPSPYTAQAPWTTARCNRLLRPLISKLDALRKRSLAGTRVDVEQDHSRVRSQRASRDNQSRDPTTERDIKSSHGNSDQFDRDWIPGQPEGRKLKNKYSAKGSRNERRPLARGKAAENNVPSNEVIPGLITVATPVISRAKAEILEIGTHECEEARAPGNDGGKSDNDKPPRRRCVRAPSRKTQSEILSVSLKPLKKAVDPSLWNLYEGLSASFEVLLKATSGIRSTPRTGTRSLFSSCLRQMPEFIKVEDRWNQEAEMNKNGHAMESDRDIASNVFAELETLGTSSRQGWKPLREVVRAYGVSLLADAARANILHPEFLKPLILLCVESGALADAETLLASFISASPSIPEPSSPQSELFHRSTSITLNTLAYFAKLANRRGFQYRQLTRLLRNGRLSPTWLSTGDMAQIWALVIQSLSQEDQELPYAIELATVALSVASDSLPEDGRNLRHFSDNGATRIQAFTSIEPKSKMSGALDNTIFSLLATLFAIAILEMDVSPSSSLEPGSRENSAIYQLLWDVSSNLQRKLQATERHISFGFKRSTGILFVNTLLLLRYEQRCGAGTPSGRLNYRIGSLGRTLNLLLNREDAYPNASGRPPVILEDLARMINMTASCCGRATQEEHGFRHVEDLVNLLLETSRGSSAAVSSQSIRHQLSRIALECAYQFADRTEEHEHIVWAESIERMLCVRSTDPKQSHSPLKTPGRTVRTDSSAYRWDNGLCEWILATPAMTSSSRELPSSETPLGSTSRSKHSLARRCVTAAHGSSPIDQSRRSSSVSLSSDPEQSALEVDCSAVAPVSEPESQDDPASESGSFQSEEPSESESDDFVTPCADATPGTWHSTSQEDGSEHLDPFEDEERSSLAGDYRWRKGKELRLGADARISGPRRRQFPGLRQRNASTLQDADYALVSHREWKENILPHRVGGTMKASHSFTIADDEDELSRAPASSRGGSVLQDISSNRSTRRSCQLKELNLGVKRKHGADDDDDDDDDDNRILGRQALSKRAILRARARLDCCSEDEL